MTKRHTLPSVKVPPPCLKSVRRAGSLAFRVIWRVRKPWWRLRKLWWVRSSDSIDAYTADTDVKTSPEHAPVQELTPEQARARERQKALELLLIDILTLQTSVFAEIDRLKNKVMDMMAEEGLPDLMLRRR
jgi:hypothetical protein